MNGPAPIRYDVAALGELVIDMLPAGSGSSNRIFTAKPGGAPGNVAAGAARLGLKAALLSKVGPGAFGNLLIETLASAGVQTRGVVRSKSAPTALAVVSTDAAGQERTCLTFDFACSYRWRWSSGTPDAMTRIQANGRTAGVRLSQPIV